MSVWRGDRIDGAGRGRTPFERRTSHVRCDERRGRVWSRAIGPTLKRGGAMGIRRSFVLVVMVLAFMGGCADEPDPPPPTGTATVGGGGGGLGGGGGSMNDRFDIIATRTIDVVDELGRHRGNVIVHIGRPWQGPAGQWAAPYQVLGLRRTITSRVFGLGAIHALPS
jgi:hypothetical protein